jgi:hypothetical protein
MVVLSKKSWHTWLYRQFFSEYSLRKTNNLCPYFWKIVLCVIILPVSFVLALPALIFMLVADIKDKSSLGESVGKGFAMWAALGLVINMIAIFFTANKAVQLFGLIGWTFGGVLVLGLIITLISESLENRTTLVGEFMKAKKNKYCPKIEWKDDERTEVLQEGE